MTGRIRTDSAHSPYNRNETLRVRIGVSINEIARQINYQ